MNFFKDLLESIPNYRKIVLLVFLIENDYDLLKGVGFSKNDSIQLSLEFKIFCMKNLKTILNILKIKKKVLLKRF